MNVEQEPTCPECGSERVVPIVYGLAEFRSEAAASPDNVKIGGCMVSADSPAWHCNVCEAEWGRCEGEDWYFAPESE
jgi:hypothetical protein